MARKSRKISSKRIFAPVEKTYIAGGKEYRRSVIRWEWTKGNGLFVVFNNFGEELRVPAESTLSELLSNKNYDGEVEEVFI